MIFFGAGYVGRQMLSIWEQFNIIPDFFADNEKKRWGAEYCGIRILSIEELKKIEDAHILITCKDYDNILRQLQHDGIKPENLYKGDSLYDMLCYLSYNTKEHSFDYKINPIDAVSKVLFDLTNNFVLGGVETWAIKTSDSLYEKGRDVRFVVPHFIKEHGVIAQNKVINLHFMENLNFVESLQYGLEEIKKCLPCNIICNFPLQIFEVVCAAKMKWPQEINLIAIVHNDEEIYYKRYCYMSKLIDVCMVISTKIRETLLQRGFPDFKIKKLDWEISCTSNLKRTYSERNQILHIGYAGRVTVVQKRADLLLEVSRRLYAQGIKCVLEIAGTGDYLQTIKEQIEKENLDEQIKLLGYIPNEKINNFWERQDIVISCSDYEGRSIAQAEAMAAGVVPVITDTSGAEDYVQDGYNGYIVPVGDTEQMVDRIKFLEKNRDLLKMMGERSHQKMWNHYTENDLMSMWEDVLK